MRMRLKSFLMLAMVAGFWSCAPEIVPSTGPHVVTTPEQIKIYQKQPSKYERLGTVTYTVTSIEQWQQDADGTTAFNDLVAKAGAMGANGLLLRDDTNSKTVLAGAKFRNTYYLVPLIHESKTVIAQAIYVLKEWRASGGMNHFEGACMDIPQWATRFWGDLIGRPAGPMAFRFLL